MQELGPRTNEVTNFNVFIDLLLSVGLLKDPATLSEEKLRKLGSLPVKAIAQLGICSEKAVIGAIVSKYGIPYCDLAEKITLERLTPTIFNSHDILSVIADEKMMPLWELKGQVVVATPNPFNTEGLKVLEFILSKPIKLMVCEEDKLVEVAKTHYNINRFNSLENKEIERLSSDMLRVVNNEEEAERKSQVTESSSLDDNLDSGAAPIIKLANKILADGIIAKASDIHLEPGLNNLMVRYRIDGVLKDVTSIPRAVQGHLMARIKVMARLNIAEKDKPQDGRLRVTFSNAFIDLRVSSVPTSYGEKIVLRILGSDLIGRQLSSLGMPKDIEKRMSANLHKKGKLLLVSGPTGSGKTTTLYVCIQSICDGSLNITTIEDPIEYRFQGVNQIQVNEKRGISFPAALRSVLRQDPDVIMVGEIRDEETLKIALNASQTGHLVISTVHTNDAPSAITRLLNLEADPMTLSGCLIGVLAQRLVRKLCPDCIRPLTEVEVAEHREIIEHYNLSRLRSANGCERCGHTGYNGRMGIYSYLEINSEIASLIKSNGSQFDIARASAKYGFKTIEEESIRILNEGLTSIEEVRGYLDMSTNSAMYEVQEEELAISFDDTEKPFKPATIAKKPTIVIVDDNISVRKILERTLGDTVNIMGIGADGVQGYELVKRFKPDILLSDLSMPNMDGHELLVKVKNNPECANVKVAILTIEDDANTQKMLMDRGASLFVSKNQTFKDLPEKLLALVR